MKNNNSVWAWVFGILVVILVVVLIVRHHKAKEMAMTGDTGTSMNGDDSALTPTEDVTAGSVHATTTTGTAPVTLSYANALITYKDARIQLDNACSATPNAVTFKNNTNIMLDNRSATARTIHMGSLGDVSIKGYGFKIVNLSSTLLPNVVMLDCGTSQNVATITIQK